MISEAWIADQRDAFEGAVGQFDRGKPVWILTHNDADGLAAAALLARAFPRIALPTQVRILGRGENPWSEAMGDELRAQTMGGLIVTDLGIRPGPIRPDTPTIIIDHHVPRGAPPDATGHLGPWADADADLQPAGFLVRGGADRGRRPALDRGSGDHRRPGRQRGL